MAPVRSASIGSTTAPGEPSWVQCIKPNFISMRALHRRTASSGTIGVAVGLTLLAIIIMGGLFYCAWENIRAEKRRILEMKEKRRQRRDHRRHEKHVRGGHRRHSKKHHHHGEHHVYLEDLYMPETYPEKHHRQSCRHKHARDLDSKPCKRHHRCRNKHDDPPSPDMDGWAPRRPEPILQSPIAFVPKYDVMPPNEMDAPQIGRGFRMADCFPQRGKGVDDIVCPRHGVVRGDGK